MASTGAILMGRGSYDGLLDMGYGWPYGDTPVLVATSRPLEPAAPTVSAVNGTPAPCSCATASAEDPDGGAGDAGAAGRRDPEGRVEK